MAPTKKNLKETHLADQESTGIDVPAEVQGNIELAPAEVAKPKRGRPSTKAAKTDGNDEKKPKKIKKVKEKKREELSIVLNNLQKEFSYL